MVKRLIFYILIKHNLRYPNNYYKIHTNDKNTKNNTKDISILDICSYKKK